MITIRISIPRWSRVSLGAAGFSILAHAAVLLLLGSLIISGVEPRLTPAAFSEPADLEPPPLLEPDLLEPDLSVPDADGDAPEINFDLSLAGDSSPSAALPMPTAPPVIAASLSAHSFAGNGITVSGGNPADGGDRIASRLRGKINIGTIFNTQVESARLGVILDISSSAHRHLPLVVSEINRNFPDAVIILAYGGGMYAKAGPDTMWLRELGGTKPGEPGAPNTLGQIARAEAASGDTGAVIKKFRARKNVYVLYAENCGHTHFGFEKLIKEKVDTVYWFSDFQDTINPRVASGLADELRRRRIKVIAHNFSGGEVSAEGRQIALATGGSIISHIPGARKKSAADGEP